VVTALEDRTVPSGGSFFGGLGDFFGHFSPPGPATHLQVFAPESVQAGQTFGVVVEAEDASNHLATGFTDTVSLASSDGTATGSSTWGGTLSGLPLSYTFTAADHGIHFFQVNLTTQGSESVTASDTTTGSTVTSGTASTTVNPAPTLAQLVVVTPENAAVGVPTRVIVAAVDQSGHLLRNFTGTVSLSTSDSAATGLPATYTFTSSDYGVHSFQVTFETPDAASTPTTVTASDGAITGSASINVQPATTVTHFAIFARGPALSGSATAVQVVALNASNQVVTGYTGTVTFTSSDSTATAAATSDGTQTALSSFSYTFGAADAGKHTFYFTFGTTGRQTLTATDGTVTSTGHVYVVSMLSHHGFWWWF
jgi:hypothetical protein